MPGAWIDATPLDNTLEGGGFGSFKRTYPHATVLTLTAPPGHNGIAFVGWKLDGGEAGRGEGDYARRQQCGAHRRSGLQEGRVVASASSWHSWCRR